MRHQAKQLKRQTLSDVDELCRLSKERFPDVDIETDRPAKKLGTWFVDLEHKNQTIAIQWQESKGFGVSARRQHGYGEGPDELYPTAEATFARIVSLLLSGSYTRPPCASLSELRRERGISQVVLAETMSRQQAAISKLEHREDMRVSSLRDWVEALGAELDITARFPDGTHRTITMTASKETD